MGYFSYSPISPGDARSRPPKPTRVEPGAWPKLEAALAVVNRDVMATLPDQEPLLLMLAPAWAPPYWSAGDDMSDRIYVAMSDGHWQGNAVNPRDLDEGDAPEPDDPLTVLAIVAEAAQDTIMELLWQAWPVCSEHRLGMHPRPMGTSGDWYRNRLDENSPPIWWCRGRQEGGWHDVCPVGELAATLPGKQRRELRRRDRRRNTS
jgi:hypothetical protein